MQKLNGLFEFNVQLNKQAPNDGEELYTLREVQYYVGGLIKVNKTVLLYTQFYFYARQFQLG